jgi:hypothetical protein
VGKRTLAEHLLDVHRVAPADRMVVLHLTADLVRAVEAFAVHAPLASSFKAVVLRISDASEASLNMLLKILEEPPASMRFLLLAAGRVLPTVFSRAVVERVGMLSPVDVATVLIHAGVSPGAASDASRLGQGSVAAARSALSLAGSRGVVLTALRGAVRGDQDVLDAVLRSWDASTTSTLGRWAAETLTGRWVLFSPSDWPDCPLELARKVLVGIDSSARPRMVARSVLESLAGWPGTGGMS